MRARVDNLTTGGTLLSLLQRHVPHDPLMDPKQYEYRILWPLLGVSPVGSEKWGSLDGPS